MSKIVGDLQRFQIPYSLVELPDIQNYLNNALEALQHGGDVSSLYVLSYCTSPRQQLTSFGTTDIDEASL
jgi:hypothetical protein